MTQVFGFLLRGQKKSCRTMIGIREVEYRVFVKIIAEYIFPEKGNKNGDLVRRTQNAILMRMFSEVSVMNTLGILICK